jgi:hypothetical protein
MIKPVDNSWYWLYSLAICGDEPLFIGKFIDSSHAYPKGRWFVNGAFYTHGSGIAVVKKIPPPAKLMIDKALRP